MTEVVDRRIRRRLRLLRLRLRLSLPSRILQLILRFRRGAFDTASLDSLLLTAVRHRVC
jgi:hypothetical protein